MHPLMLAAAGPAQTFAVQVFGFVILAAVLVKLVLPQLGKILAARTQSIDDTFKKLDQDTQDAVRRIAEIKEKLAQMNQESERRLKAALDDAERTRAQLVADSNAAVQAALDKARREIQIEFDKAVAELRQEATTLTIQAADHLVQTAMNESIHEKLVDKYLGQLDGVKKT